MTETVFSLPTPIEGQHQTDACDSQPTTQEKHKHIRLHGHTGDQIEYSVMVAGTDPFQHYFFSVVQEGNHLRTFSPGNEFVVATRGITYQGNGGFFCEYMFGVAQPSSDLSKPEIINRLIMYGARTDDATGTIVFSDHATGSEGYEKLFFDGNAVCNYFFFVHTPRLPRQLKSQQEELVKRIGKSIKRSTAIGNERDDDLIAELFPLLQDDTAHLYIIKLINRPHREYRDLFRQLYFRCKKIADHDFNRLVNLAAHYNIDPYQQERMRIDVMYRHPDNKRIVDEYRNILLACSDKGEISNLDNARLTRLKTLSVRTKIPGALFQTLDKMLQKEYNLIDREETDYLASTRQILEGLFLREKNIVSHIDHEDMYRLISAKKIAVENRDRSFDQLILDVSRECDEKIRDGADSSLLKDLSRVVAFLDRFDSVANLISQLAFMENVRISKQLLREMLEHKASFDSLQKDCFHELFIKDLFSNIYLGRFGRRKVATLMDGLARIEARASTIEELNQKLHEIDQEERASLILVEHVRDRIRNFYSTFNTEADQEKLRREVLEELRIKGSIQADDMDRLFNEAVITIKKEAMYLHTLLPTIVAEKNLVLREDFLENSGLDRFYVEELEREYYERNELDMEELYQIRKGLN
ncbi:TIGR04442 family protein [Pelotalea chapellei]|uniref:TIGR04442 family protein n=1 Tax=Pelotalea chapellei TaxID=44671 RepID=A0ABS5U8K4_9BACT|nr:TIGR04442 family protein [Pelotalea chapellei]MBT1071975.1 TIGR04442 family protein [Pelotalea chapellei]